MQMRSRSRDAHVSATRVIGHGTVMQISVRILCDGEGAL